MFTWGRLTYEESKSKTNKAEKFVSNHGDTFDFMVRSVLNEEKERIKAYRGAEKKQLGAQKGEVLKKIGS